MPVHVLNSTYLTAMHISYRTTLNFLQENFITLSRFIPILYTTNHNRFLLMLRYLFYSQYHVCDYNLKTFAVLIRIELLAEASPSFRGHTVKNFF